MAEELVAESVEGELSGADAIEAPAPEVVVVDDDTSANQDDMVVGQETGSDGMVVDDVRIDSESGDAALGDVEPGDADLVDVESDIALDVPAEKTLDEVLAARLDASDTTTLEAVIEEHPAKSIHAGEEDGADRGVQTVQPSSYSSVSKGYVTSVKDQCDFGTGWAFVSLAAVESSMLHRDPNKAIAYAGEVTKSGSTGAVTYAYYSDAKCTKSVKSADVKNAGTYYVKATVAADANHTGATSAAAKLTVNKAAQPMAAKAVARTAKYATVKAKAVTVAAPLSVTKAQGKVTYAKVAKGSSAALTINKSTGKVTVKKGTKKGTYKIKVKVTAAGNKNYKSGSKAVTCKVAVK